MTIFKLWHKRDDAFVLTCSIVDHEGSLNLDMATDMFMAQFDAGGDIDCPSDHITIISAMHGPDYWVVTDRDETPTEEWI